MLDVAVIIPELAKHGGAECFVLRCLALWKDRFRLTVYTCRYDPRLLADYGVNESIRFRNLTPPFSGEHALVLNGTLLPKIWEREIGTHDVYHTHLWPTHLIDREPMVWYPHEPPRMLYDLRAPAGHGDTMARIHCYPKYNYDELPGRTVEASLNALRMVNESRIPGRVIANSEYVAGYLSQVYGCRVDEVVYPGVDLHPWQPPQFRDNVFVAVGQLWPHKRFEILIEAAARVEQSRLVIVGAGPHGAELRRIAANAGIGHRVEFRAGLDRAQLRALYSGALAVLHAAVNEPFGIVPLEGLAAGVPLIAVAEGGYAEIADESCAFLVEPDPAAFADRMAYLIANRRVAKEMGAAGRAIAGNFTWEHTTEALGRILSQYRREPTTDARDEVPLAESPAPVFGVQYYCWYGGGTRRAHWNDRTDTNGITDQPVLGLYDSTDPDLQRKHLIEIEDTGFDLLIVNLHVSDSGLDRVERDAIGGLFRMADEIGSNLRLVVQLCPYTRNRDRLAEALEYIAKLARSPLYFAFGGQPVVFVFWSGFLDRDIATIRSLREHSRGFYRVASGTRIRSDHGESFLSADLFDAWSIYCPLELSHEAHWETVWSRLTTGREHGRARAKNMRVVTVSPGYDDRHLRDPRRDGNPYRYVARNGGETYEKTMRFALQQSVCPDLIVVSTFNEYHENTHIEESRNHGSSYLQMTRRFIDRARKRWCKVDNVQGRLEGTTNSSGARLYCVSGRQGYRGVSICISTDGRDTEKTGLVIRSIQAASSKTDRPVEIILCGDVSQMSPSTGVRLIDAAADARGGWLAKLRNTAGRAAQYDVLVFADDDILFPEYWFTRLAAFTARSKWNILGNRILLPDGGRYWDRATAEPHVMVPYSHPDADPDLYQTGCFWVLRRHVFDAHKWDAAIPIYANSRTGSVNEDVEYSRRLIGHGYTISFDQRNLVWHLDPRYQEVALGEQYSVCVRNPLRRQWRETGPETWAPELADLIASLAEDRSGAGVDAERSAIESG